MGSVHLAETFSSHFFVPEELNDSNPREFSTPAVYRLPNVPLIDPNTEELSAEYHTATFMNLEPDSTQANINSEDLEDPELYNKF